MTELLTNDNNYIIILILTKEQQRGGYNSTGKPGLERLIN